jgi:hypothetical protein
MFPLFFLHLNTFCTFLSTILNSALSYSVSLFWLSMHFHPPLLSQNYLMREIIIKGCMWFCISLNYISLADYVMRFHMVDGHLLTELYIIYPCPVWICSILINVGYCCWIYWIENHINMNSSKLNVCVPVWVSKCIVVSKASASEIF